MHLTSTTVGYYYSSFRYRFRCAPALPPFLAAPPCVHPYLQLSHATLPPSQPASPFEPGLGSIYAFFLNFIHFVFEALVKIASAIDDCWLYRFSVLGLAFHCTTLIERYGTTVTIKFITTPVPVPLFASAHRS